MFGEIARFLINIVFTLFGAALILRAWMSAVRLPPRNPISQTVFQLTDWLVLPLRRLLPAIGKVDWACLIAAWLTALVYLLLVFTIMGMAFGPLFPLLLGVAFLTVFKWAVNLVMLATLLLAVLSWINPRAPAMSILQALTAPLLDPIRRVMPSFGGMDLSPLVLFVIAQILLIVVARLGFTLLGPV